MAKPITASMTEAARSTGIQVPPPKRTPAAPNMTDKSSIAKYINDNAGTKDLPTGSGK